ncbi:hypothetical protein C660_14399 [Alcaligenes sp. HPC1271]|nr:hypothetical protein C660_14399 [Alcaligenes sp. HPC1271]
MLGAQVHAQNKNVTLVVPYPPGGAADQLARVISQEMGTRFDQKVIVENRPGAGAQVAMNVVKNANPSSLGTVLFLADSGAYSLNRHLYQRLNYDVATDLIPMTLAAKRRCSCWSIKTAPSRRFRIWWLQGRSRS